MIVAGIAGGNALVAGRVAELDAILAPCMIPTSLLSIGCGLASLSFAGQIIYSATKKPAS